MHETGAGDTAAGSRPLVVTGDRALLAEVSRLAAATGAVPEVVAGAAEVADVRRVWGTAPLVLLGDDCADALGSVAAAAP